MKNYNILGLKKIRKRLLASFITTSSVFLLISCNTDTPQEPVQYISKIVDADGSLKRIIESGVLKIGTDPNLGMPYINKASFSEYEGFEFEISKFIANQLGCKVKIVPTNWENLLTGLEHKDFDIALNSIERPEDDKSSSKNIGFSVSYFSNFQQIVVKKDNADIKFLKHLKNKAVGVVEQSVAGSIVSELNELKNTGIKATPFSDLDQLFVSLQNNSVNAVIIDSPIATWSCKDESNNCKKVGFPIINKDYVVAVRKDDRALLNGIDAIIREGKKDGKINSILKKWDLLN